MKVFVFDAEKCSGCYGCQVACKDEHCGMDWLPYAKAQPDVGQFWLHIHETEHGQVPKVKVEYKPVFCQHCDDAPCIAAGDGAVYKREDGLVIIDPVKAAGNQKLVDSCPYGAIYWNAELQLAQKCTGCAQLVDQGEEPRCVDFCALKALRFGEEEEFAAEIAQAETDPLRQKTRPRVYYLNMPKLFIGGEVWDPELDEVITGATITLTDAAGQTTTTASDEYGDFWFKKLEAGNYSLSIAAEGFIGLTVVNIELNKSLNLGDFPLQATAENVRPAKAVKTADEILAELGIAGEIEDDMTGTVQGLVVNNKGEALAGAEVALRGRKTFKGLTDENGAFSIAVTCSGDYLLNVKSSGYKIYGKALTIAPTETTITAEKAVLRVADASEVMTSFS